MLGNDWLERSGGGAGASADAAVCLEDWRMGWRGDGEGRAADAGVAGVRGEEEGGGSLIAAGFEGTRCGPKRGDCCGPI